MAKYCKQAEEHGDGDRKKELLEKESDEMEWLNNQIGVIFDKFEPFIGFEKY